VTVTPADIGGLPERKRPQMLWTARAAVTCVGLGLLLGAILLVAAPGEAGVLDASWTAPTTNTDGSQLTDLAFYRVYYGASNPPCPGSSFSEVASLTPDPPSNQTVSVKLAGLSTGTVYNVAVTAVDGSGTESDCSTAASAAAQITFSVPTGTVSFGTVNVGSFANQVLMVQNTRGGTIAGTVSTSAPFSVVSGSPFTLVGLGATQTVTLRFSPTVPATATVNISFIADGDTISRLATGVGSALDTTAPTVTISTPTSNPTFTTSGSSLTLGGTAADNVGVTQVTWANSRGGSGTATGTASWTAAGIALQLGTNVLTVTARDAAGNTVTDIVTVTRTDATPPTVTITTPTSNPTYTATGSTLTLGGTASDNVGVTQVTWANSSGGSGTATGTASWTAGGIVLQTGPNVLTITARDAAGNTATDTVTVALLSGFTFTDDPVAAQSTPDKAVHVLELRAAIDSVRVARGLAAFVWTDPTLTPGSTAFKVIHVTELRTALNQAYQAAGQTLPTYTDPAIVARVTVVKAIHLNELRAAVSALP
jgi:hypothetical protein